MHWKIKRDHFYNELYPLIGEEGIKEAGFFYDNAKTDSDIESSINLLCTPFSFEAIQSASNPVVLLCTGSFCPAHKGHLAIMMEARKKLESEKFQVVAGYFSPGHDEYIYNKNGVESISSQERIRLLQQLIDNEGQGHWLAVDPWEAIFNKVAVNFTDVITRLELYLKKWTSKKINVCYVCGADNARFALTFLLKGNCVIAGRPSYELPFNSYKRRLNEKNNIFWIDANYTESSTEIRKANNKVFSLPKVLSLRIENLDIREAEIAMELKKHFSRIRIKSLKEQKIIFEQFNHKNLISLDSLLPTSVNLKISRCYDVFGSRFIKYIERPGSDSIKKQIESFDHDVIYNIFDDDLHSGGTKNFAKDYLTSAGIRTESFITLTTSDENEETLDARDFIIGGINNGLVVNINDCLYRVPYVYPYCCPYIRASIQDSMNFSIEIWRINKKYFENNFKTLDELPEQCQKLFLLLKFKPETALSKICEWHIQQLLKYI
jgi:nicotinic acid mononucleotide adenylyltransferase